MNKINKNKVNKEIREDSIDIRDDNCIKELIDIIEDVDVDINFSKTLVNVMLDYLYNVNNYIPESYSLALKPEISIIESLGNITLQKLNKAEKNTQEIIDNYYKKL